jgi:hypothetical protein
MAEFKPRIRLDKKERKKGGTVNIAHNNGVSGSTSMSYDDPLMVRWGVERPP